MIKDILDPFAADDSIGLLAHHTSINPIPWKSLSQRLEEDRVCRIDYDYKVSSTQDQDTFLPEPFEPSAEGKE